MFKFVHVWGFGFKGKLDGGGRETIWSAPEKKLGRGEGRIFNLAKSGPEKKSPWAVCNHHEHCDTIARPFGRNIGIISNCLKKNEKICKKVVDSMSYEW